MLAETTGTPDGTFMSQIMSLALFVGNMILAWVVLADRNKSQKREVSFTEEFARKEDLVRVEKEIATVNGDLQKLKETIIQNGELRKNFIIAHIDSKQKEVRDEVKGLRDQLIEYITGKATHD